MGPVPFALSIHHFITSVGSDAGFASIIGLAILILLYFAQARETASLRNHAQEAAERIQQLESRLAQISRGQSAPPAAQAVAPGAPAASREAPAGAAAAGAAPPSRTATPSPVSAIPAAPAGVGAPALTAATKLIPTPQVASVAVADPVPAGATAGAVAGGPPAPPAVAGAPGPSTVAGGANGAGRPPSGTLAPAPAGPARQTVPPRTQLRSPGTIPPSRRPPNSGGRPPQGGGGGAPSRGRRILAVLAALLVVAAVVVVLLIVTGGSSSNSSSTTTSASNAPRNHRAATFNTSQVTVAVLNGTSKANLAHDVGQKLVGGGYQEGTIATAQDQTHSSTIVAYLPGFKRDALAVAGTLKLKPAAVQAVDSSTQAVACPPPSTCKANVVVTVGSDLANTP